MRANVVRMEVRRSSVRLFEGGNWLGCANYWQVESSFQNVVGCRSQDESALYGYSVVWQG